MPSIISPQLLDEPASGEEEKEGENF